MTLSTDIYVMSPVADKEALWERVVNLIEPPNPPYIFTHEKPSYGRSEGVMQYFGAPGQNANAWAIMSYVTDDSKPFVDEHDEWEIEEYDEDDLRTLLPDHYVTINFDTGYAYSDEWGGCATLHARYIVDLGSEFDKAGIDWYWKNEFTGQVHHRYDGIEDFIEGGVKAGEWFTSQVLPHIRSMHED